MYPRSDDADPYQDMPDPEPEPYSPCEVHGPGCTEMATIYTREGAELIPHQFCWACWQRERERRVLERMAR